MSGRDEFSERGFLLPLPTTQEWGEEGGEGHSKELFHFKSNLLSPALSSIGWRRGSVGCGVSRAEFIRCLIE